MHTTHLKTYRFHHNGDYSGHVLIKDEANGNALDIPFDVLKDFVAEALRQKRMGYLERMTSNEVLGLHDIPEKVRDEER